MARVSVVGLGKLGACVAAVCAAKGQTVVGVDVNPRTVALVNEGRPPVVEPGLRDTMVEAGARLRATTSYDEAIAETDVTLITVPTPSAAHGGFSLRHVRDALTSIGRALRKKGDDHLVVVSSTVLPGSMDYAVIPLLTEVSGRRPGPALGVCYSPEFIALGSVIRDFRNPDFVLVGESDMQAGDRLAALYAAVCDNHPRVARMSLINAELTKIAVNTFVTMKISFANMLAALCEELPGGDVDVVTQALGLDRRIGGTYLKGALGYGGPCFPRDNIALGYLAAAVGRPATLAMATDEVNRSVVERIAAMIEGAVPPRSAVAILGLAYKPDTPIVEESQGLQLAARLADRGFHVAVFDPLAVEAARAVLGDRVRYAGSVAECVAGADAVLIANPDPAFADLTADALRGGGRTVVIDARRTLRERLESDPRVRYVGVGLGSVGEVRQRRLERLWQEDSAAPPARHS